jgi:predicted site-specific integrase-resolvase
VSIKHFDQKQLAERWGISPKTLERWRWLGQGPKFLKLGGRIAYRLEDIEAFEQEQLRSCTSTDPTMLSAPRSA